MTAVAAEDEPYRKTSVGLAAEVERLLAPTLDDLGYEVVRVLLGKDRRRTLQLMIDRKDGRPIDVEDCAAASRAAAALLDVEDPIRDAYVLEVSSPGIDRPLTRLKDFARFAGHLARIETSGDLEGRKRFTGQLAGVEEDRILLDCEGDRLALSFAEVIKAKLVLTDALIEEHQAAEAEREGAAVEEGKE